MYTLYNNMYINIYIIGRTYRAANPCPALGIINNI